VQISWKINPSESPYLFLQQSEWTGLKVHRARVLPGRLHESAELPHKINVSISGNLTTEKTSSAGKRIVTRGSAGNLCITPSGQSMGASWDKTLDNLGFLLEPDFVVQTAVENRFSSNFEFTEVYQHRDVLIQQIGLTLLAESSSETASGRLYADSLIQTLTLHLLKNYTTADSASENTNGGLSGYKLRRVKEFIDANLEEDLSLREIACIADLSQYHFARAFRKSTNMTTQQYVMHRRIERAKQLLAKDDLPIVEISLRTGFKNQSHFTTLFHKFTKLTPKMWRELKLA
jgi:AraC family transcriptional regulator